MNTPVVSKLNPVETKRLLAISKPLFKHFTSVSVVGHQPAGTLKTVEMEGWLTLYMEHMEAGYESDYPGERYILNMFKNVNLSTVNDNELESIVYHTITGNTLDPTDNGNVSIRFNHISNVIDTLFERGKAITAIGDSKHLTYKEVEILVKYYTNPAISKGMRGVVLVILVKLFSDIKLLNDITQEVVAERLMGVSTS